MTKTERKTLAAILGDMREAEAGYRDSFRKIRSAAASIRDVLGPLLDGGPAPAATARDSIRVAYMIASELAGGGLRNGKPPGRDPGGIADRN